MKIALFLLLVVVLSSSVAFAAPPAVQEPVAAVPPEQNSPNEMFTQGPNGPHTGDPPGYSTQQRPDMESAPLWKLEGTPDLRGSTPVSRDRARRNSGAREAPLWRRPTAGRLAS
jgi:hypothetical protein